MHVEALEDRRMLTITVDTLVDELDGSILDGDVSLRDAIAAAPAGETIDFAVTGAIRLKLGELTISQDVTISGPGAEELTIDAQGNSRVTVVEESAVVEINGLTLTGGVADDGTEAGGGGILNFGELTIVGSTISGNSFGGIANGYFGLGAKLFVIDAVISGNTDYGILNKGTASVTSSAITQNSGSGISNRGSSVTIRDMTISENHACAVASYDSAQTTVSNSTLSQNGCGVRHQSSEYAPDRVIVAHSTISGNGIGVAISAAVFDDGFASASIANSVISGNSAGTGAFEVQVCGGQVYFDGINLIGDSSKTTDQAFNVGGTYGSSCYGGWALNGSEILATVDGNAPTALHDILDTTLADNGGPTRTHALAPGSPAIDAGDPNAMAGVGDVPLYDQRGVGFTRVSDGDAIPGARIDIGAYELQPPPVTCDFDGDESCDLDDIDALVGVMAAGTHDPLYDLTGDALVDLADRDAWLAEAGALNLPSGCAFLVGDANLDGRVDGQDFIAWNQNKWTYTGSWSQGDFNADGTTDGQDFVIWNMFKFQESDEALRTKWERAVPYPAIEPWALQQLSLIQVPLTPSHPCPQIGAIGSTDQTSAVLAAESPFLCGKQVHRQGGRGITRLPLLPPRGSSLSPRPRVVSGVSTRLRLRNPLDRVS